LFSSSLMAGGLIAILSTLLWAIVTRSIAEPARSTGSLAPLAEESKP
jgi:hypothetical protein